VQRAWYASSIETFRVTATAEILGTLANHCDFTLLQPQRDAWRAEIEFLRDRIHGLDGRLFFEFSIPRMGRRVDVVLLTGGIVFVVEFKVGARTFDRPAFDQVWDYALDLKNFHEASHPLTIVPLLVATDAVQAPPLQLVRDPDGVVRPVAANGVTFRDAIEAAVARFAAEPIDVDRWGAASYRPTPTIIEAARALYAQHSVDEIARHDAGAENLRVTSQHIEELVAEAERSRRKVICFVTGVPGAGKTLVGLNIATRRGGADAIAPAVYLSGNDPLVAVLREALTRDEVARQKANGVKARKGKVAESVKAFIQNVHHFRDDVLRDPAPPVEHVAIFDEAQRAWNLEKTVGWMRRKKNIPDFGQSEAQFLLSSCSRRSASHVTQLQSSSSPCT
jgi:hypothetical protein